MEPDKNQAEALSHITDEAMDLLEGDAAQAVAFVVQETHTLSERETVMRAVVDEVSSQSDVDERLLRRELFLLRQRKSMGNKVSGILISTRRN